MDGASIVRHNELGRINKGANREPERRYECRDGTQRMWISPIVRPKTGGVALGDALEMGETAEGRFASLF